MAHAIKINPTITTTHTIEETEDTYAAKTCCLRCGGFLVDEQCMDFLETHGKSWFWATRCIQCGDLVDDLTLRNRAKQVPAEVIDSADPFEMIQNAMEHAA